MSGAGSNSQAREHLLEVVERYRRERCAALLDKANAQARELVRQAYREARGRVQRGIAEVRLTYRHRIAAARARQQTRLRQQRQRENSALLAGLWEQLQGEILLRWQQRKAREMWIEALVQQAAASLLGAAWTVEHPPDWPLAEQNALRGRLDKVSLSFVPQAAMTAGLRICAGGACVDGSLNGLLRDRAHIESLLLARLGEACRKKHSDCLAR